MFRSVKLACQQASAVWGGVAAFGASFEKFNTCLERIQEFSQKQAEVSKGATLNKKNCRKSMCAAALVIAGQVHACATENNELELAGKVDVSLSTLLEGRDRASAERCQTIHRLASEKVAKLAEQGVNAAKLKSLQTKIDDCVARLQRPRQIISEGKTATGQLEVEIEGLTNCWRTAWIGWCCSSRIPSRSSTTITPTRASSWTTLRAATAAATQRSRQPRRRNSETKATKQAGGRKEMRPLFCFDPGMLLPPGVKTGALPPDPARPMNLRFGVHASACFRI